MIRIITVSYTHLDVYKRQEDGEGDSLHLNDKKNEQVITGTVDLFTKDEYDQLIDDIQNALSGADISFILNSVQYEEETEFIHYEWRFEI